MKRDLRNMVELKEFLKNPSPKLKVPVYTENKDEDEPVKKHKRGRMTLTKLSKQINARFDTLTSDVNTLKQDVNTLKQDIKDINTQIDNIEKRLDYHDLQFEQINKRLDYNGLQIERIEKRLDYNNLKPLVKENA